jgi:hypothetical protein
MINVSKFQNGNWESQKILTDSGFHPEILILFFDKAESTGTNVFKQT